MRRHPTGIPNQPIPLPTIFRPTFTVWLYTYSCAAPEAFRVNSSVQFHLHHGLRRAKMLTCQDLCSSFAFTSPFRTHSHIMQINARVYTWNIHINPNRPTRAAGSVREEGTLLYPAQERELRNKFAKTSNAPAAAVILHRIG